MARRRQRRPTPAETPAAPSVAPARRGGAGADAERPHNRVYDHLVEGEDDVIGLITYSLYKQDKRDWLMAWKRQHGREPTATRSRPSSMRR